MYYFLGILDDLVLIKLKISANSGKPSAEQLKECLSIAVDFKNQFQDLLFSGLLKTEKDKQVKKYIQTLQPRLIFLANVLFESIPDKDKKTNLSSFKKVTLSGVQNKVCLMIEELISILEVDYGQYFNFEHSLPLQQRFITEARFRTDIALLKSKLKGTDPRLMDIITSQFNNIRDIKNQTLSFRKATYLKELLLLLNDIAAAANPDKVDLIIKTLFLWNFNSWKFEKYLTAIISSAIDKERSHSAKLKKYYYYAKIVNQIYIVPGRMLCSEAPSLNFSMSNWISEEIQYLIKNKQCESNQLIAEPENKKTVVDDTVVTSITVAQLAFLVRLLLEVKVIMNPNLPKLLGFFAAHFQTKKTNTISFGSFHDKYYAIEDPTKQKVKEIIIKLFNHINKYYLIAGAIVIRSIDIDLDQLFIF